MTSSEKDENLPPPPPIIPPNVKPEKAKQMQQSELPKRHPTARPGFGTVGRPISLLSNYFNVRFTGENSVFYQYNVSILTEDDHPMEGKDIGRKIIENLQKTYSSDLGGKYLVHDGEKCLLTLGSLPQNNLQFTVIMENSFARDGGSPGKGSPSDGDRKRSKRMGPCKKFKVEIRYSTKVPLKSLALAIKGKEVENTQDALRVLDIILRQQAAKRGDLLVKQSFFNGDPRNFVDLGGGVTGCRGFHSSFRTTHGGLSLNMDTSTTMIVTPGPVLDFLLKNQNVRDCNNIDWAKAKRMLKNLRIKTTYDKREFKIIGLSDLPCNEQVFTMKTGECGEERTVTVYDYFVNIRGRKIYQSAYFPCVNVGKPKRPVYIPLEFCCLLSLQRYKKALSTQQRASLVEHSRQKPQERIRAIQEAVKKNCYDRDPVLASCGISIETHMIELEGRVLNTPKLIVGGEEECVPRNGRWNYNSKTVLQPKSVDDWALVNFSARCNLEKISWDLHNCGKKKGINIQKPLGSFDEDRRWIRSSPATRVEKMIEQMKNNMEKAPKFILCVLPERKNCDIYGPWKSKCLHELGIPTQCISPTKINDQYLTNVLLKINTKLGGINSLLINEERPPIPSIKNIPTMILGMDVSHGSPSQSDIPSVAAVVGSRQWPLISRYRASVRTQSPKVEMIDSLYKPQPNGTDDGIIHELLLDFYKSSNQKPKQIIIFRDGVSESQFDQVLNIELDQIIEAYKHLDNNSGSLPKFTVIVAQKNHHTKLFQKGASDQNVPPGTVVDSKIVHPKNYEFYMCSHAGMIGTSRPTRYNVLLDEIGFSPNELQELVHALSYVYQRSTTAISIVAPIAYAHLAAAQMSQFVKFDTLSESSSLIGASTQGAGYIVPELPRLNEKVSSSMFFC